MRTLTHIPVLLILIWITGCELLGQNDVYNLTVSVNDPIRGTVTPSSRQFEEGAKVTLEADVKDIYENGFRFGWWSGDVSGEENPHTFTIRGDTEAIAVIRRKEHSLTINIEGQGSVVHELAEGSEGGVAVDFPDLYDYQHGSRVQLEAFPASGSQFCYWRGENYSYCDENNPTGSNPQNVRHPGIFKNITISAIFAPELTSCPGPCVSPTSSN
ncbi:MAG: hypothetical protein WD355_01870 [Balneolaceae bacterium]